MGGVDILAFDRTKLADAAFWVVAGIDAVIALALIFADDSGQDAAGKGVEQGFGIIALLVIVALVALYRFVRTGFVRVPVFVVLLVPAVVAAQRVITGE